MKLQLSVDLKKLIQDVRGPKGAAALTEEFERLSKELNRQVKPQAQAQMKKAEAKYMALVKKLHAAQKDLDKEVSSKIGSVKKQAKEVEKNLNQYKKLALKQKAKIQKAFTKKAAGKPPKKKTSAKRASKKATAAATAAV